MRLVVGQLFGNCVFVFKRITPKGKKKSIPISFRKITKLKGQFCLLLLFFHVIILQGKGHIANSPCVELNHKYTR